MPEDKVRIGIIGANASYGWSMRAHLPALLAMPEYDLTAVCTAHKETAEESAKHYRARLAFHDYHKMVNHPDVDLVAVSVRVPLHHQMVMAALEAGKHVFCEWPLGANLGQAEEMASLARSKGVATMIGLQGKGDPVLLRVQELVEEGYVGEVLSCNMAMFLGGLLQRGINAPWMADREMGAGTLAISTGHAIDALCMCVGEFSDVSARTSNQVPEWDTAEPGKTVKVTSYDNVLVAGTLASGAAASVHVATVPWHGNGWRMEIYGMEGTLTASSEQMVQYANIGLRGGRKDGPMEDLEVPDRLTKVSGEVPKGPPFNVAQLYSDLAKGIREGNGAQPDFDHAVVRHKLLDAIERSSEQGARVRVA